MWCFITSHTLPWVLKARSNKGRLTSSSHARNDSGVLPTQWMWMGKSGRRESPKSKQKQSKANKGRESRRMVSLDQMSGCSSPQDSQERTRNSGARALARAGSMALPCASATQCQSPRPGGSSRVSSTGSTGGLSCGRDLCGGEWTTVGFKTERGGSLTSAPAGRGSEWRGREATKSNCKAPTARPLEVEARVALGAQTWG